MFIVDVDVGVGLGGVPACLSKQEDADAVCYGQDRQTKTKLGWTDEVGTDCLIAFVVGLVTGRLNKR